VTCELPGNTRTVTRRSFLKVLAAALVPSGCNLNPEPPLRIGANIWAGYECLFIARSLRLFQPRPIKLVEYTSTSEVLRAFKNRAIEVAAMTADEFLRLAADQSDIRAILVMDVSKGADALIGRSGHASIHDLRGKRIGVEVNAVGVYMLTRALASVGLRTGDVEPIALENHEHFKAFTGGKVDAVVTFEPHRSRILQHSGRILFDSSKIPGEIVDYLVTRESVLTSRGPAIRALLKGWFEARERLLVDGEETARLVAARQNVTASEFLGILDLLEIPSLEKNKQLLSSQERYLASLQKTHTIMVENGLLCGELPRHRLSDGGFLP
jgi:NitT/TauT family transport system substrate-binding protein